MGLSQQGKAKARKRSADMTIRPAEEASWGPPDVDECEESNLHFAPPGASEEHHRIHVRMVTVASTGELVEFAVVQQTQLRGRWHDVCAGDSRHGSVHIHRYSKRTDQRIGDPEPLRNVVCQADVQDGYDDVYGQVVDSWEENLERWRHG